MDRVASMLLKPKTYSLAVTRTCTERRISQEFVRPLHATKKKHAIAFYAYIIRLTLLVTAAFCSSSASPRLWALHASAVKSGEADVADTACLVNIGP